MKTIFTSLLVLALAFSATSASAQVLLDVSKITCWQFVTYKVTNPRLIAIWVSGYYHGKRGDTVVDTQDIQAKADKVEEYCTKNPDVPMMDAVETVLGAKD
jgi:acid stress chaperone HdeB